MNGNAHRKDDERVEYLKGVEAVQYWELLEVVGLFNKRKIPVMLLKGAVELAVPEYSPQGHRPRLMGDIDLLVHKEDWENAVLCLASLGYRPIKGDRDSVVTFKMLGQNDFVKDNPYIRLDLHYQLHKFPRNQCLIDVTDVWKRRVKVKFKGRHVFIPSVEDHLWYLLVHFFYTHESSIEEMIGKEGRLWYIVDSFYHHRGNIDWERLLRKAIRLNVLKSFFFLLYCVYRKHGELLLHGDFKKEIVIMSYLWYWVLWVKDISPTLTHAAGRFTIGALIREYSFFQSLKMYYFETIKWMGHQDLLRKYRMHRYPFLIEFVKLLHLGRLLSLHILMRVIYIYFNVLIKKSFVTE
jgi:hypothetical protein